MIISLLAPSFLKEYKQLPNNIKEQSKKAYKLWKHDPYHKSLHFKCIIPTEDLWSVRINQNYRALGFFERDECVWVWIGPHDEYMRKINKL